MSFLTEEVFTLDNLLHLLGGAALAAPLWMANPNSAIVAGIWSVWGLLREQGQSKDQGWIGAFFYEEGGFKWHKLIEGLAWGVGGGALMLVANLVS